ncbi:MAG: MarR family winged helix-turn-helix transcriptional regulator [Anaerolineales bacterium]|jgi:DNA-binding MarR family transcriptional regulator
MSDSDQFQSVLHEWIGVFMRNAMRHFLLFAKDRKLSMPQIGALFQIRRMGVCSVSDIGGELGITKAAASQLLEGLVKEDLVRRSEDPNDRRAKRIVLTDKGLRILRESVRARQGWLTQLDGRLTERERSQISAALRILIEKSGTIEQQNQPGG